MGLYTPNPDFEDADEQNRVNQAMQELLEEQEQRRQEEMALRAIEALGIRSFGSCVDYLQGRQSRNMPGRATVMTFRDENLIAIKFHNTDVVSYTSLGNIIIRSDSWSTRTTVARINAITPDFLRAVIHASEIWVDFKQKRHMLPMDGYLFYSAQHDELWAMYKDKRIAARYIDENGVTHNESLRENVPGKVINKVGQGIPTMPVPPVPMSEKERELMERLAKELLAPKLPVIIEPDSFADNSPILELF